MKVRRSTFATIALPCFAIGVLMAIAGVVGAVISGDPVAEQVEQVEQEASLDNLLVTITGLKEGDVAAVTLLPEAASEDSDTIFETIVTSKGTENIVIDMSSPLKDGYYRLNITAPDEYFREPRAWLFMVVDLQLVNPQGKSANFNLIPPELQTYKPYRESSADTIVGSTPGPPPSQPPSTMVESMQSLSAPAKQPIE